MQDGQLPDLIREWPKIQSPTAGDFRQNEPRDRWRGKLSDESPVVPLPPASVAAHAARDEVPLAVISAAVPWRQVVQGQPVASNAVSAAPGAQHPVPQVDGQPLLWPDPFRPLPAVAAFTAGHRAPSLFG